MSEASVAAPPDPVAILRSRAYLKALALAAILGIPISAIAYGFLALVQWLQGVLYDDLPDALGMDATPVWWPMPLLALSGLLVAASIRYLPGTSGHSPADGLSATGFPAPAELPGVFLAALAGLSLGIVLGPEAPLIALGGGLGALAVRLVNKNGPPSGAALIAAAGSFAAVSTLLGSPILGAFLLMEAAGVAGAMLGVTFLPGLLASGIGFLIFTGLDALTGLGTFSLALPNLPAAGSPTIALLGWAVVIGLICPVLALGLRTIAQALRPAVHARRFVVTPLLGVAVGGIAAAFALITDKDVSFVLFSGQDQLPDLITEAATWSVGALVLVALAKSLAYALSLSAFRGGPIFPSMFIGAAIGIAMSGLPGMSLVPGLGMGIGAMCVSMLRLPFTSVLLASVMLVADGLSMIPLIIVSVVTAFITANWLPQARSRLRVVAAPPRA